MGTGSVGVVALMKRESMKVRIERGIALLDKKKPTWCKKIKLEALDLSNPWQCVLGHIYGSKESMLASGSDRFVYESGYEIGTTRLRLSWKELEHCGFTNMVSFDKLTAAWKRAIKKHCA